VPSAHGGFLLEPVVVKDEDRDDCSKEVPATASLYTFAAMLSEEFGASCCDQYASSNRPWPLLRGYTNGMLRMSWLHTSLIALLTSPFRDSY